MTLLIITLAFLTFDLLVIDILQYTLRVATILIAMKDKSLGRIAIQGHYPHSAHILDIMLTKMPMRRQCDGGGARTLTVRGLKAGANRTVPVIALIGVNHGIVVPIITATIKSATLMIAVQGKRLTTTGASNGRAHMIFPSNARTRMIVG